MKAFSVGFIFNKDLKKVLLMHKTKPEFQAGKLNGLGGKIEGNETSVENFVREIKEEANLDLEKEKCIYIGKMQGRDWWCDTFGYIYDGDINDAKSMEIEQIEWFDLKHLPENLLENVGWLIEITLDKIKHKNFTDFIVNYK